MTQWQCEFRDHIRALTQWLKNMEMRLPPLESRVSLVYCRTPPPLFFLPTFRWNDFSTFSTLLPSFFTLHFILELLYCSSLMASSNRLSSHCTSSRSYQQSQPSLQWKLKLNSRGQKGGHLDAMSHAWSLANTALVWREGNGSGPVILRFATLSPTLRWSSCTAAGETSLGHRETESLGEAASIVPGPDSQAGEVLAVGGPLHRWAHTLKGH